MKTIFSRITKLEDRILPRLDEQGRSPAHLIWEARQRFYAAAAAAGREIPIQPPVDPDFRPRSTAEAIIHARNRWFAANVKKEVPAPAHVDLGDAT